MALLQGGNGNCTPYLCCTDSPMAVLSTLIALALLLCCLLPTASAEEEWVELFNGQDLGSWVPNESPDSWQIANGLLIADGPRSHLFYHTDGQEARFTDFELVAEIFVHKQGSSAIYFHAANCGPGWGVKGLPVKITNTRVAETATGGIYYIPETSLKESPVADEEWFTMRIRVEGMHAQVFINDELITDYTQEPDTLKPFQRTNLGISSGTIALQCHGKGQRVDYRSLKIRRL